MVVTEQQLETWYNNIKTDTKIYNTSNLFDMLRDINLYEEGNDLDVKYRVLRKWIVNELYGRKYYDTNNSYLDDQGDLYYDSWMY